MRLRLHWPFSWHAKLLAHSIRDDLHFFFEGSAILRSKLFYEANKVWHPCEHLELLEIKLVCDVLI